MEGSPNHIFISYSRGDGREFAEAFERRLEGAGITAWRDLKDMESGDIRPQVLRAIEASKHLVLILSRRALTSNWIKREWSHARMMGKKVSPVMADPSIKRSELQPWIRREEIFEIDTTERWTQLVRILEGPGETRRAPWMPGDLSDRFVPRPAEYVALKEAVRAAPGDKAVALTTALVGAGGYGKTTLANYLCRDDDVRFEFADGILRVEIGKERGDVTGLVIDLIEKLDPGGKRPGFQDVVTASEHLGELIGESRVLLVIDDVWREAQLRPFLRGGKNCVRLVTTRLPQVLSASHIPIAIDEMRAAEALSLIAANLPGADKPAARVRLAALADRLGNWAQMVAIANGWMCARVARGETLADAIARFERRLSERGLTGFDPTDKNERTRAIRTCVEASLEDLTAQELDRLGELAVLPEDESVPLGVIEALWRQTGGLDADETDDLVQRFYALSLLQNLDLGARTLRLHDNMIWYLRDRIGPDRSRDAHATMVRAIGAACAGAWATLPPSDAYGWRFLIRHMRAAEQGEEADRLLADYAWLKAKLRASGARGVFDSYLPESSNEGARLIGRAIALSLPAIADNPRELPRQLYGRLGGSAHPVTAAIVASARQDPDFRPAPRWPGLTPPGAERLRLVGHEDGVYSAWFSPDGTRIVTASSDRTARLWDATTGQEIVALRHEDVVRSACFSPDGARIVTAFDSRTARLWDATTGQELPALRGHESNLEGAYFTPDGARTLTTIGAELNDLTTDVLPSDHCFNGGIRGHVLAASADETRIVTRTDYRTATLWDATNGTEVAVLRGHLPTAFEGAVSNASFSSDGARLVTASPDKTARIWDATSRQVLAVLRGHESHVNSACFSPDGARIVTASLDKTARIWDAAAGSKTPASPGHDHAVSAVAFSPEGTRIVTCPGDANLGWDAQTGAPRVWDTITGVEITVLCKPEGSVTFAAFSPDGARITTVAPVTSTQVLLTLRDVTMEIWDATTGREITDLRRHYRDVASVVPLPDGGTGIVTIFGDRNQMLRLSDSETGREIAQVCHDTGLAKVLFSPDMALVLIVPREAPRANIWDTTTQKKIAVLEHDDRVWNAAFSTDSARVVTTSADGTVRIWDRQIWKEVRTFRGHKSIVWHVAFSPDETRIVTTGEDDTIRIWDTASGTEITRIALDARVTAFAMLNGNVAVGDALGRIHVFDADEFLSAKAPADG